MELTDDLVAVHRRVEGVRHLSRRAGENKEPAARRNLLHGKSVTLKPPGNPSQVAVRDTKTQSILLRREPLVEERRPWFLLRFRQLIEIPLLGWARLQNQHHAVQPGLVRDGASIKFRA